VANWRGLRKRVPERSVYIAETSCEFAAMIELIRTNDAVVISFVESLMRDADIGFLTADQNMSVLDGSIGILPRRILVEDDRIDEARRILTDAGIANEIRRT
jgi:ethanolamine utilization protein EutP (predicted NTPase)